MIKIDPKRWTEERLLEQKTPALKALRENAVKHGEHDLAARCDTELERRSPKKERTRSAPASRHDAHDVVAGYHFVCQADRGVTSEDGGRFRTGSWVVAEERAKASLAYGAYVALHESKADGSYRQGRLVGYQHAPRDMLADDEGAKISIGIEFIVASTTVPYAWVGDGAGEKGYLWSSGLTSVDLADPEEGSA